jgi:hypothetical protein
MLKLFDSIPVVLGSLLALSLSAGLASGHASLAVGPGAVGDAPSIASSLDATTPVAARAGR